MIRKKLIGLLDSREITLGTLYLSLARPAKCWGWTRVGVLGCLTHSVGTPFSFAFSGDKHSLLSESWAPERDPRWS